MSRPLKAGLDYFPHDTMAHADPKIASLMALYGAKGYAFYFILLEIVFRSENGRITIGKQSEKIGLAHAMCLKLQEFDKILISAIEIGCFDEVEFKENNVLTSNGVSKRIHKINNDRGYDRKRKEAFKEKESNKEKEYKYKEKAKSGKLPENSRKTPGKLFHGFYGELQNVKLSAEEHRKLQEKFNSSLKDRIEALSLYIASKGDKYKSHYATILSWERKNSKDNPPVKKGLVL